MTYGGTVYRIVAQPMKQFLPLSRLFKREILDR